ncbi:MAG: hypothetical protein AAF376_03795 [Pseudomonadota bacterium]
MPRSDRYCLTVSPPTLDRTAFAELDQSLPAPQAPFARDWLMARFAEGLEIRMLRAPLSGFVAFQPGRLSWRPILGADDAVVIHSLRVAEGPKAPQAVRRLRAAVEGFARYYGYSAVLALLGSDQGLIAPNFGLGKGWIQLDEGPGEARLVGRVLQGPIALPSLPRDWRQRAASVGPGLVVQTTGESAALNQRAERLEQALRNRGLPARRERFADADTARRRATHPGSVYSVVLDGIRLGGPELSEADVLRAVATTLTA